MPASLLKRADLERIAYVRPTLPEQKSPAWACESCHRTDNHACRLQCRCGFRPGKSHTDKVWAAHRRALAVPQSPSSRAAGTSGGNGSATAPWARNRGGSGRQESGRQDTDSQVAKLMAELDKLKKQSENNITLEKLREIADASGNISGEALLQLAPPPAEEKPAARKPPKHSVEAERRTKKAQNKLEKAQLRKTELDKQIEELEAQRLEAQGQVTEATAELETAKREEREQHLEQLKKEDGLLCIVPAGFEDDAEYALCRKRFEDEVKALRVAKAAKEEEERAKRERDAADAAMEVGDVGVDGGLLVAPQGAGSSGDGAFTLEELVAAGFCKPEDGKRIAATCLSQREEKKKCQRSG